MPLTPRCRVAMSFAASLLASSALASGVERARVPASAHVGATALVGAQMEFACAPGKDGSLALALILADPEGITGFPLAAFEGPDGAGESRSLATWSASSASGAPITTTIAGWYGVDGDGFLLSTSRSAGASSDFAALAAAMLVARAPTLHLRVASPENGDAIEADAVLGDQRERIAEAVAACLPAVQTAKPSN